MFIVEIDGDIVGYMDVTPELTIGRVILNCRVRPEHRRRGLATKFFGYAANRAQELGIRVAHVNIPEDNVAAKRVLPRLGFSLVRRFLELRLDITDVRWSDINQPGLGCCYLQRGEEGKLTAEKLRRYSSAQGFWLWP